MKKDEWLDEFWQDEIENIMRRRIDQLIESLHFLCRIIAKTDSIHIEQAYQTDLVHKYREYIDIYIKELKSIRKNGYKTLAMPLNHHVSTKAESFGDKGNEMFYELATRYQMYRFGRTSFSAPNSDKNSSNLVEARS